MSRSAHQSYGTVIPAGGSVQEENDGLLAPAFVPRAQTLEAEDKEPAYRRSSRRHTSISLEDQQMLFTFTCLMFCALPSLGFLLYGLNRQQVAYEHAIASNSTLSQAGTAGDKAFYPFLAPMFLLTCITVAAISLDKTFKLTEKAGSVLSALFCCGKRDRQRQEDTEEGSGVALLDSKGFHHPAQR